MEERERKRIYLAGKIGCNDWRHDVVKGLGEVSPAAPNGRESWPTLERAIFGRFDYGGPFFVSCDHGCYHGQAEHGYGLVRGGCGILTKDPEAREWLTYTCMAEICRADLFFAWVDSPDAYGTLIELGIATGYVDAHHRPWIVVARPPAIDPDGELWFAFHHWAYHSVVAPTPQEALARSIHRLWVELDSPLETAFWREWGGTENPIEIYPQYPVFGGRYWLDFAEPDTKTAIELDGFSYHSDKEQFKRDRKRDRELAAEGWTVMRFSGEEIRGNVGKCVREVSALILSREP